ncbi:MAG: amino acid ABC transporter permease [Chloroflexota bacterium]
MDNSLEPRDGSYYVAPAEPPPPRRPPVTEVGIIGWAKENLFKTTFDSILTVITIVVLTLFLFGFLTWAMLQAQWEIVFLNLRQLSVGNLFPQTEIWRIDLIVYIIVFLSMMSVSIWGKMNRVFVTAILTIIGAIIIIPALSRGVPEPTIHIYVAADYEPRIVKFVADEGQEVEFTLDPLTTVEEYRIENISGFIENNNQQGNTSFDAWNERSTEITFQGGDPSVYDIQPVIEVQDRQGNVRFSRITESTTESQTLTWEVPFDGWFTVRVLPHPEEPGEAGAAWLKIDGIQVYRGTPTARAALENRYGTEPEVTSDVGVVTELNRTDIRFQGERTLAQFFSLQLSPYLVEVRDMFYIMVIIGLVAYLLGQMAQRVSFSTAEGLQRTERTLVLIGSGLLFLYLGIQVTLLANPLDSLSAVRFTTFVGIMLTATAYGLIQFAKEEKSSVSRGLTILWLVSIPLVWTLLTGFEVQPGIEDPPMPQISSAEYGGLMLTLLLSAVAIIASFPIGILLALGRQSNLPVVSLLSTLFIEVLRGVPLITLLFMGRLILPFFGLGLGDVDLLIRIMVVLTLFTSAYMAEVIRGGLQIIPRGQIEAAQALGLNALWTTVLITLPQALRAVIPAMMGQAVSLFKDTSLVYIVGLFEILGTMNQILGDSATGYTLFPREGYLYVGMAYFVFSYLMADVSRRIERTGAGSIRRDNL